MDIKQAYSDLLEFFKGIPAEGWCTKTVNDCYGRHCALGHIRQASDSKHLVECLINIQPCISLMSINDDCSREYPQETPKARIVAFFEESLNKLK